MNNEYALQIKASTTSELGLAIEMRMDRSIIYHPQSSRFGSGRLRKNEVHTFSGGDGPGEVARLLVAGLQSQVGRWLIWGHP